MTTGRRPSATTRRGTRENDTEGVRPSGVERRGFTWRLSEWPVSAKVVAVIAIPSLIAATFGLIQVAEQLSHAGTDAAAVTQSELLPEAWAVLAAGDEAAVRATDDAPELLDEALATFMAARDETPLTAEQEDAATKLVSAAGAIKASPGIGAVPATLALSRAVSNFAAAIPTEDRAALARVTAFRELVTARLALSEQRSTIDQPAHIVGADPTNIAADMGAENVALNRISASGDVETAVEGLLDRNNSRLSQLSAGTMPPAPALAQTATRYNAAAEASIATIGVALQESAAAARSTALLVSGAILALLLAGLAAALLIARSLSAPLDRVRRATLEIANEHLPQDVADVLAGQELHAMPQIPVTSNEEMGQLARAVESMYGSARGLATEQAALRQQVSGMFETLSRRSNALVDRQLSIVEKLERDEPDAQRLASLFELDHLAARMRRNGESLLVLAGARGRAARAGEITVIDAARAASAEVADYQRVVMGEIGGQIVTGAVSSDLIHLFAELLDNALSYSSPQTNVLVIGARTADGGMLVEIVDEGLGIAEEERDELNKIVASSADLTPETARRMGLFVVGRLAAIHGISVSLRPNPNGGTIAAIALPVSALVIGDLATQRGGNPGTGLIPVITDQTGPLAPVADISERVAARDGRDEPELDPNRPSLARRVPGAAASVSSAGLPVRTHRAATTEEPAAEEAPRAPALPQRGRAEEPAPEAPVAADADSELDEDTETRVPSLPVRVREREMDPSVGVYSDTADPRTIRTWVSASSAEPGDEDDVEDAPIPLAVQQIAVEHGAEPGDVDLDEGRELDEPLVIAAEEPDVEQPVYASTRSRWLTDTGSLTLPWDDNDEILAGATAAARAARPRVAERTTGGLPRRAPGSNLVPGAVSNPDAAGRRRDPQAVRESMNRHLSGVRRGRAALADPDAAAPSENDD